MDCRSSRMIACLQIGLLCFGLLVSSHGGETASVRETLPLLHFDEQELPLVQLQRVQRQTSNPAAEEIENGNPMKKPRPRPGRFGLLSDIPVLEVSGRTKRHDKTKKRKRPRISMYGLLSSTHSDEKPQIPKAKEMIMQDGKRFQEDTNPAKVP
ncbi:hypothetical protein DNTS_035484 [Danionella cerebrum]|uniref:Osteocrin n=1 Tax=Danionella cerebrum TaxID=2873325 RepID=A0A553R683_9TELE|nr:hypothetical protein DNTS_035484 [Danionella translucida]